MISRHRTVTREHKQEHSHIRDQGPDAKSQGTSWLSLVGPSPNILLYKESKELLKSDLSKLWLSRTSKVCKTRPIVKPGREDKRNSCLATATTLEQNSLYELTAQETAWRKLYQSGKGPSSLISWLSIANSRCWGKTLKHGTYTGLQFSGTHFQFPIIDTCTIPRETDPCKILHWKENEPFGSLHCWQWTPMPAGMKNKETDRKLLRVTYGTWQKNLNLQQVTCCGFLALVKRPTNLHSLATLFYLLLNFTELRPNLKAIDLRKHPRGCLRSPV